MLSSRVVSEANTMPRAAIGVRQEDQEIKCHSDNNFNNRNALSLWSS